MISNVLLINQKGEVVISRIYREGASQKTIDTFRNQVIASKEAGRLPVKVLDHTAFMFIKHGNMYAVAVSSGNAQAALAFQFLHELIKVLKSYFGDFTEESVRNNFILIYELLDEVLDYGYPQNTSDDVLKMYITQEGNRKAMQDRAGGASSGVTIQATGAISWRKEGIKYRKNELFIDVVENCNLLMSSKGTILRNEVSGCIMVKCYLSGQPECKFGLNDKLLLDNEAKAKKSNLRRPGSGIDIDDVSFHQCVKLGKFDMDRTISFVPPDGEFQLMSYRITENVNLPFRVLPVVKELGAAPAEGAPRFAPCSIRSRRLHAPQAGRGSRSTSRSSRCSPSSSSLQTWSSRSRARRTPPSRTSAPLRASANTSQSTGASSGSFGASRGTPSTSCRAKSR